MSTAIDQAFGQDNGLRQKIHNAIRATPTSRPLFEDIAAYHLRYAPTTNGTAGADTSDEPAAKKRKLTNGAIPIHQADATAEPILEVKDVSFSIPQRKKFHFRVMQYTSPDRSAIGVQTVNPGTGQVDYELPGSEISRVLRLPVPEKATKQFNYLFITKPGSTFEPILFTVPATPLKPGTFTLPTPATTLEDALVQILRQHELALTLPDEKEFASAVPEPHRKSEKAYHVKAFRGSKDGYLFFLSDGILFGFKKPLLFLAFDDIESISYTSVLQRTFNLSVAYRKPGAEDGEGDGEGDESEEIEFSMLDQADYAGINDYVQRHGLNDASLAAGRRAKSEIKKKASANGGAEGVENDDDDDDGRTELEKAEQQLQDEESEEDEDFDPDAHDDDASGSESDGSDSDDDDDDEEGRAGGGGAGGRGSAKRRKDLVQDELGSEAEDVEASDDEEAANEEDQEGDEEDEEEDQDTDEDVSEVPVAVKPQPPRPVQQRQQRQQPVLAGRWGAPVNKQLDPDDEDQL